MEIEKVTRIKKGTKLIDKNGEVFEVISDLGVTRRNKRFLVKYGNTNNIQVVTQAAITAQKVKDLSKPFCFNVGYAKTTELPKGYLSIYDRRTFVVWYQMMYRCYSSKSPKCYDDVFVIDEWHNFYSFNNWCEINNPKSDYRNLSLDKDLFSKGALKVYSPETCCFLPSSINSSIVSLNILAGYPTKDITNKSKQLIENAILEYDGSLTKEVKQKLKSIISETIKPTNSTIGIIRHNQALVYIQSYYVPLVPFAR